MAQTPTLQTSDFRPSALDHLKTVAEQGIWANVTRYNLPYVEIHPAGTAERLKRLEPPMPDNPAYHLDDQGHIQPGPQALAQTLLTVHHGDAQAAARALLAHIQAEQAALALLLANGGDAR